MYIFLTVFFVLYSGMHYYAFLKARAALALSPAASFFLIIFLIAMVSSPFMIRWSEKAGLELPARLIAYTGYFWLGVLFIFCSCSIALDIYNLLVRAASMISGKDMTFLVLGARHVFLVAAAYTLVVATYGYTEAKDIRVKRLTIKSPKVPVTGGPLRIVQISDIHLGLIIREERLRRIVALVKAAEPDIVVSTGDLVDGQVCNLNGLSELLLGLKPKYGKFAITGNHEFYAGFEQARCFIANSGFVLLRDSAVSVDGFLNIAGVDDPAAKNLGLSTGITEGRLLSGLPRDRFTLFLKHRPLVDNNSKGLFDLQLSGHVHGGQIFPFTLITKFYYPVYAGFTTLTAGSHLYVSRGTGTWGPPIRFLSPPEIAVIDIVPDDGSP